MKPNGPKVERRVAYALAGSLLALFAVQRLRGRRNHNGNVPRGETAHFAVTVNRPADETYALWRDVGNAPRFMSHIESVMPIDATRSRWVARLPAGFRVEWDSEIVDDIPSERISWRTIHDRAVRTEGAVSFRTFEHRNATQVDLGMRFDPAGGPLTRGAARLMGENPQSEVKDTLRRFKQLAETGEIATSAVEVPQ